MTILNCILGLGVEFSRLGWCLNTSALCMPDKVTNTTEIFTNLAYSFHSRESFLEYDITSDE